MSSVSASLAAKAAPTFWAAAVFSMSIRVGVASANRGGLLPFVVPEPLADQPESPSSLVARTST